MALSKTMICNMAIGWLGGTLVTSVENDASPEAALCRTNYDVCRDAVLEERNWSFAIVRKALAPSGTPPDFGFTNQFTLPADCVRVVDVSTNPTFNRGIDWEKEGNQLLADTTVLYIKYVGQVEDETKFSDGFAQAFAARIAMEIALPLTNSPEFQQQMQQLYAVKLERAGTLDGMQGTNKPTMKSSRLLDVR